MKLSLLAGMLLLAGLAPGAARGAPVRVAFVVSDGLNLMDFAGPWEVFQDVVLPAAGAAEPRPPFELYTVATHARAVTSAGGAALLPRYTLATAPRPQIVVVGAQGDDSPELLAWLRAQHAAHATLVSVCTGARKLALAGLLDGRAATTHHEFLASFRARFPAVRWQAERRWVRADDRLYTAGGLTAGIDLALHLVAERYGGAVAQATADYLEYRGDGWRDAP